MAKSIKKRDEADSERLELIFDKLQDCSEILNKCENTNLSDYAVLRHLLDNAVEKARKMHEWAYFGATGRLLEVDKKSGLV